MTHYTQKLLVLTTICASCAYALPAYGQDAELLTAIEEEYEAILGEVTSQRDRALKALAAAERAAAVQAASATTYRQLYIVERANADKPVVQRWTWFALGAVSAAATCFLVVVLVP